MHKLELPGSVVKCVRDGLLDRLEEKEKELKELIKSQRNSLIESTDRANVADHYADTNANPNLHFIPEHLRKAAEQEIRNLKKALNLLKEQTFGVCQDCGEELPVLRLIIAPWATKCATPC